MNGESNIKLVVEKRQLIADLHYLNAVLQEYQQFLDRMPETENWEDLGLTMARTHLETLSKAKVSLKSMELVEAILRTMLKNLPLEEFTFKPSTPGPAGDEDLVGASIASKSDGLQRLIGDLQGLARHSPLAMQEKIRILLVTISNLFSGLIDGDEEKITNATDQINLLTSSRESQNLIREIAFIAREIYDSLNSFTSTVPLSDLTESTGGISVAVNKLNSVIIRLEEAANQNLDAIETSAQRAGESQSAAQEILDGLRHAQQQLGEIRGDHPELSEPLSRLQDQLGDGIGARIMFLQEQFTAASEHYMALMANQSFQDLTGQTLRKIIHFVENLERQLVALLEKYRPVLGLTAPKSTPKMLEESQASPVRQDQDQVDALLADLGF